MSNSSVDQEPKGAEESQHSQRSIRDLLINHVRNLVPSRCQFRASEAGTSSGGAPQSSIPKLQAPKPSTQNGEPNVTVLHVRASVQRTTPAYRRPADFSEQVNMNIYFLLYISVRFSCKDSEMEITISPPPGPPKVIYGPPPVEGAPPSYSAVMRLGPFDILPPSSNGRRRGIPLQPSPPFIAPAPPPTYAEAEGFYVEAQVASGKYYVQ